MHPLFLIFLHPFTCVEFNPCIHKNKRIPDLQVKHLQEPLTPPAKCRTCRCLDYSGIFANKLFSLSARWFHKLYRPHTQKHCRCATLSWVFEMQIWPRELLLFMLWKKKIQTARFITGVLDSSHTHGHRHTMSSRTSKSSTKMTESPICTAP